MSFSTIEQVDCHTKFRKHFRIQIFQLFVIENQQFILKEIRRNYQKNNSNDDHRELTIFRNHIYNKKSQTFVINFVDIFKQLINIQINVSKTNQQFLNRIQKIRRYVKRRKKQFKFFLF